MAYREKTIEIRLRDWGEWYVKQLTALKATIGQYELRVDYQPIKAVIPNYFPHKIESTTNKCIAELPDNHIKAIVAKYAYRMPERRALKFCHCSKMTYYGNLKEARAFIAGKLGLTI